MLKQKQNGINNEFVMLFKGNSGDDTPSQLRSFTSRFRFKKCPVVLESLVKENCLEQQYQNTGVKRVIREEEG